MLLKPRTLASVQSWQILLLIFEKKNQTVFKFAKYSVEF